MNKIFSTVWNEKLGCLVAASEHARRNGGTGGSRPAGVRVVVLASIAGVLGLFPIQESAALQLGSGATATANNTSIGDQARIDGSGYTIVSGGSRRTDALGLGSVAGMPNAYGVALGYAAQNERVVGTALGSFALTSGLSSIAIGNHSTTKGRLSLAIGTGSFASAGNSMAIGSFSAGAAARAMAIGNVATASGVDSNAIGTSANASGARSIAFGATRDIAAINGEEALQNTTTNTSASGEDSVAIGTGARSTGKDTIALGTSAAAAGTGTIAMGAGASAAGTGSVALGTSAAATGTGAVAIGSGASANSNGGIAAGVAIGRNALSTLGGNISIGDSAMAGGGDSVAIGHAASTVSINGVDKQVALGDSARTSANAATALGHNANATTANSVALGAWSTTTSNPAAAAFNPGSGELSGRSTTTYGEVSVGATDRERRVTNLAAGAAATDAVNVSQLRSEADKTNATGAAMASALGGDASYDASTGAITAPSYSVGGGTVSSVGDAIGNLDGRVSTTEGSLMGLNEQLESGAIGLVRQDAESGAITVAAGKAGSTVDFAGIDGARTLMGVAAGELSADSLEAVNGSQLFATNERVSAAEGDITTINTTIGDIDGRVTNAEGSVTNLTEQLNSGETGLVRQDAETGAITVAADKAGSSVDFAGTDGARTLTGVAAGELSADSTDVVNGSQLFATNERVSMAETSIDGLDDRLTTTEGNVSDLTGRVDTAEGDIATINTNVSNLDGRVTTVEGSIADLNDQLNSGETGLVRQDAESGAITVAADKAGSSVDFAGTDGARTLTGVAAGELAEDSTDAVNGSQLFATNERVSMAETTIEGLDGRLTTTEGNVGDLSGRMDTAEGDITTINTNVSNLDGRMSTVEGDITTINTTVGDIDGRVTNVEGSVTNLTEQLNSGEAGLVRQDADSGAITVAADKAGGSVDFAGTDGARTLTGVAAGELSADSTDAVNGAQLFATNERVSTTESNIEGLDDRLTTTEGNVGDLTDRMGTAEGDITTINTNVSNLDGRVTTVEGSIADLSNQLNSGETGLVRQDADAGAITVAADKAGSSVDFAGTDGARTLTGVAAGELSADSTDAVNGSQLFATNERVSTVEGEITTINTNISGIDGRVTDVEGSVTNLTEQLNSGEAGLVRQDAETGAITVAAEKAGSSVDFSGIDGARKLAGVAAGELSAGSTEAVNGSQLFETNERVGAAETNIEGLDGRLTAAEGDITAINTNVAGLDERMTTTEGNVVDLTDRIDTAEGDITTINTNVSNLDGRMSTVEGDITTINATVGNIDGRVTNVEGSVTNLAEQLNSGETGLVRQNTETGAITVAADKAGSSVDFSGIDGARKLAGVAAGELSADSTDAVNGSQLFVTNERVSTTETNIEGLDGRLTTAEGDITAISTNVAGLDERVATTEGNVGDLTDRMDTAEGDIATINTNVGNLDGRVSTVEGDIATINTNIGDVDGRVTTVEGSIADLSDQLNSGETGLVRQDAEGGAITVAADKAGSTVDFSGTDGARTLTGVAAGELAENSTDAVNGAQLFATNERVSMAETNIEGLDDRLTVTEGNVSDLAGRMDTAEGDITTINTNVSNLDGRVSTVEGDITTINTTIGDIDGRVTNVEGSVTNLAEQLNSGEAGLVLQDADSGAITVAADKAGGTVDFAGLDGARTLTGVAAGELSADSMEAVNGSQLFATNERVGAAETNIEGLDGRLTTAEGDITTLNTNVAGLDDRLTTTEGNVVDLTGRMDTAEGDIKAINTNVSNLDGRVTTVEGSVADLSDQLNSGETGLVRRDAETGAITVAADKAGSSVDFAGTDGARTLTGVAAGELAADSTDAVNGAQLFATNERVSMAETNIEGLDGRLTSTESNVGDLTDRVDAAEADITTLNTNVASLDDRLTATEGNVVDLTDRIDTAEGDITTINTNVSNLDGRVTTVEGSIADLNDQLNSGGTGLVRQDAESGAITVAADKAGSSVDFTGTDGARTLTGVAAGELAENSTDAVNGAQLLATNERVSTTETNIEGLDDRLTTTESNVGDLTDRVDTAEGDITTISTNVSNLDGRVTTVEGSISDLNDQLNSGETGLVRQNTETGAITVAADKAGSSVDFSGIDGARKLTGVAAGELAADSTDAVNASQLFATNERLSTAQTGIQGLDGRVTTVEGSVSDLKDSFNSGETGLVRQSPETGMISVAADRGGEAVNFANVDGQARVLGGVAEGVEETDAVNLRQLRSSGLIDEDGKTRDAVTYDSDSERRSVTFNGTGAPVLLQNVAAGRANTDGANVGQVRDAVSLMGGGAHIDANGNVVAPNYVVDEVSYSNVGDALKGLAEQAGSTRERVTVVEQVTSNVSNAHVATSGDQQSQAKAQGSNAAALGVAANASGAGSTAAGWGAQATGENSVSIGSNSQALGDNSMAIGNGARAVAGNSVAIGAGSNTTRENTVSVGSVGNERAIANVADGVVETDAVNKRQLDSSMSSALNYTNQQLNQLQNEIQSVKRDANANAAAAMAVANLPQSVIPGKGMASAAVSNMGGESAVAVGVSKFSEDGRWVSKFSGTVNTRGNAGVAAGIGFHW